MDATNTEQVKPDQRGEIERRQRNIFRIAGVVAVLIIALWGWVVAPDWKTELEALFSGLAFVGLICTVFLQREELKLQQQELIETREVLKESARAQKESEEALRTQVNSMNHAALIDAYSTILDYYDRLSRHTNEADSSKGKHALMNLKQLVDHVDKLQGRQPQRPDGWYQS